jgi:hypothetical protein
MKYTILSHRNISELINLVNNLINEGWIPQGGLCESGGESSCYYSQAMIKTKN